MIYVGFTVWEMILCATIAAVGILPVGVFLGRGNYLTGALVVLFAAFGFVLSWAGRHQKAVYLKDDSIRLWGGRTNASAVMALVCVAVVSGTIGVFILRLAFWLGSLLITLSLMGLLTYEEYCRHRRFGKAIRLKEVNSIGCLSRGRKRFFYLQVGEDRQFLPSGKRFAPVLGELQRAISEQR